MKRPNGASEVWWGHVAENQHCDEAWRHARPTADGLTQQLNLYSKSVKHRAAPSQSMDDHHITLEIEYNGRSRLQFELPADATDDEIAYFKTLVPRVEQGLLELVDPDTWAVVFSCRPTSMH